MQVTKEGIERIKSANDLAAVVAERGIELKKKGRQLVAPLSLPRGEDGVLQRLSGEGALPLLRLRRRGRRDRLRDEARQGELRRRARDAGAARGPRPREAHGGAAADPAADAARRRSRRRERQDAPPKATAEGAPLHGAPPRGRPVPGRRALPPDLLRAGGRPGVPRRSAGSRTRDLLRALKVGYADGSLLKVIPKDGEVREQLVALGVITPEGRELLGGCVVVPIPDPAHGPVDEPLRPRAEDAAPLLPARPSSRRPELPGRAALAPRSSSPSPSSTRSPSTRPASRRRSRSTARTASRRTTSTS